MVDRKDDVPESVPSTTRPPWMPPQTPYDEDPYDPDPYG